MTPDATFVLLAALTIAAVALIGARRYWRSKVQLEKLFDAERADHAKFLEKSAETQEKLEQKIEDLETMLASERKNASNLTELNEEAAEAMLRVVQERDLQRRRADEFFGMIDGVVKERDDVWKLYRTTAQQAGVAQSWLFRELNTSLRVANEYRSRDGKPPLTPPGQLTELITEFTENAKAIPEQSPAGRPDPARVDS